MAPGPTHWLDILPARCLHNADLGFYPEINLEAYIVYYESINREPKIRGIYECRCDERLQTTGKLRFFVFIMNQ